MPFRSAETLQRWLGEFAELHAGWVTPHVAPQEEAGGGDSGLIVFPLRNASTPVYLQPVEVGSPLWRVTFEARSDSAELSSDQVRELAGELERAADLCDYLEKRSRDHLEGPAAASE